MPVDLLLVDLTVWLPAPGVVAAVSPMLLRTMPGLRSVGLHMVLEAGGRGGPPGVGVGDGVGLGVTTIGTDPICANIQFKMVVFVGYGLPELSVS